MGCDGCGIALNRKIVIEISTDVSDSSGGWATTWSTDSTVWGNIKTIKGDHQYMSGKEGFITGYSITVRRRSVTGLTDNSNYRLSIEGETLRIRNIDWQELYDDGYTVIYATVIT